VTVEATTRRVVSISGTEMYYVNDVLSRPDGPAVVYPGGDEEWWMNGMLHRHDPATPDILHPAICRWGIMQFEYWIKGIFICANPHEGEIIVEWDGWVKDGLDNTVSPMKFQIIRPEPKYKSLYPPKKVYTETKKIQNGRAYGRVTHYSGDEESGT